VDIYGKALQEETTARFLSQDIVLKGEASVMFFKQDGTETPLLYSVTLAEDTVFIL